MARCMLKDSSLPKFLWAEAVSTANFIQNRTITKGANSIPIQLWNNVKPNATHLHIFGTKCFVHIPSEKRRKLDNTAKEAYFIGYEEGSKAYRLYDKSSHKAIISRDVRFIKTPSHSNEIPCELFKKPNKAVQFEKNDTESSIDSSNYASAHSSADDEQSDFNGSRYELS